MRRRWRRCTPLLLALLFLSNGVQLVAARWSYQTGGHVLSSPVVKGATVYVGSSDNFLHAVDVSAGTRVWRYQTASWVQSSPAVSPDNSTVYVGSDDGFLHAVDASTGARRWRYQTGHFLESSPEVSRDGNTVFVGGRDEYLHAIDANTGARRWRYQTYFIVYSPKLSRDGNTVYVGSDDYNLHAVDASTGAVRWRYQAASEVRSSPTMSRDGLTVYVGSDDNYLHAVDATTGARRWRYQTSGAVRSSPAVSYDGLAVYVGSDDMYLHAVDATTGARRWRYKTNDIVSSAPELSGDGLTVYVGSFDSYLHAVDAGTGARRWSFKTGDRVSSSPAVSGGDKTTVFVGSYDNYLHAVSLCSAAPSGTRACAHVECAAGEEPKNLVYAGESNLPAPCALCPLDTFSLANASNLCTPCPTGTFTPAEGQTACVACVNPEWCPGAGSCAAGRREIGCSECMDGYMPLRGECLLCPAQAWVTLLPLLVLLLVGAVVLRWLKRAVDQTIQSKLGVQKQLERAQAATATGRNLMNQVASLMSVISSVQTTCTVIRMDFQWPEYVLWANEWLARIATLDVVDAASPECAVGFIAADYKLVMRMFFPFVPVFVFAGASLAMLPLGCCSDNMAALRVRLTSAALGTFLISFIVVADTALSTWDCIGDGTGYMRSIPYIPCRTEDHSYELMVACSAVVLVLLIAVTVALAAIITFRRRELHADESTMRSFGGLYLRYEERCYFWEFLVMARKMLLVIIAKLLSPFPAAQVAGVLVVLIAALLLQFVCNPFVSGDIDRVERGLLGGCVAIALLGAWSQYGAAGDTKDAVVTAVYFVVLAVATLVVAAPMRRIWRGDDSGSSSDGDVAPAKDPSASSGTTDVASVSARRVRGAKFVV